MIFNIFSALSWSNSGSSVESCKATPPKLLQKDESTGEYIVRMSPQDFDHLSSGVPLPQEFPR